jgi:flagellar hook protein FlgE
MVGYGFFQSSTLGMRSQAHALNTIGKNVANVTTGGYKRTDTHFETVLSKTLDNKVSDIGGVRPKDYQIIDSQGIIQASERDLDLAIVGHGFFQVSPDFAGSSQTLYTRDGSFRKAAVNTITIPGNGFTAADPVAVDSNGVQIHPITSTDAYLVDKNGYYVLGWAAETNGTFSNTGSLAPMRIDAHAFSSTFTPSTTARLHLNLPSTAEIVADHASTVLAANGGTNDENLITYTAEIVDSNGKKQTARINMTKSAANTWNFSATTSRANSPQTDTIMLAGSIEAGDTYSATVNGTTVSYTTTATDTTISNVRDGLIAAINADATIAALVTATAGNSAGEVTLTALTTTPSFTSSASAANGANTAQADTITVAGTVIAGEQYTVDVDGNTVTYTVTGAEADLNAIRTNIIAAINGDATVGALVTAAPGALAGEITMTALTATSPFTSAVVTKVISTNSAANTNTTSDTTTTANVNAVAQIDTVTFGGTYEAGDQYSITIGGTSYNLTTAGGSDTPAEFVAAHGATLTTAGITVARTNATTLTFTANTAGTPFTLAAALQGAQQGVADETVGSAATTANGVPTAQVDTVSITATGTAGETIVVEVDGNTVSYTVTGLEGGMAGIRTALVNAINANGTVAPIVTAAAGGAANQLTLTASNAGTAFATNGSIVSNAAAVAQVDTATFGGTYEAGDQYRITIDGTNYDLTTAGLSDAAAEFVATHGAALNVAGVTVARASATSLTFTANVAGTAFTSATAILADPSVGDATLGIANTTANSAAVAQVDPITISAAGTAGETFQVTVNGSTVNYTVTGLEGGLAGIRTALVAAINGDATIGALVTAANGGTAGELTLTGATAGTAFTSSASTPPDTATNTASVATTTAAVTTTADNTVGTATNTSSQMSAISTVQFTPLGVVAGAPPAPLSLALSYADGGTATLSMDISDMTQYGSGYTPYSFDHDGLAAAQMYRTQFDSSGHIVGTFDDGTQRKIYKIPLATFSNPNGLEMKNGMVFAETEASGAASTFAVDVTSVASFTPYSVELSNVDLATEFSRMIMVQNAYNSSATVFRTVDEMTMTARDLKA